MPLSLENVDISKLRCLQDEDSDIQSLRSQVVEEKGTCFYEGDGVLWRIWRPPHVSVDEEMKDFHQIIVPRVCRQDLS